MDNWPEIELHGYWRSGATWRMRLYFQYRGIPYTYVPVNLVKREQCSEEWIKINPAKFVPAVFIKEGDTKICLTESMAICEYFEEKYSQLPKLLPTDPFKRWQVRRLCEQLNAGC